MLTANRATKTWTTTGACCTRYPATDRAGGRRSGDVMISVQERFNTLSNLQIETYEYGIPPIYADSEVLDFDSLQNQTAEPGAHYPARAKPGQSLAAGFFQPAAGASASGLGAARSKSDGTHRAVFDRRISGAVSAGPWRTTTPQRATRWRATRRWGASGRLAANEIFPRRRDAAGGRLLPAEPAERCGSDAARGGCGVRVEMDSARGLEGKSLQLSGNRRAVSDAVVAAARSDDATTRESRSADCRRCWRIRKIWR